MFIEAAAIKPPHFRPVPGVLLFNSGIHGDKIIQFYLGLQKHPICFKGRPTERHLPFICKEVPSFFTNLFPLDNLITLYKIPTKSTC